jgi:sn-glycerol 3-phosphate transport system substrate-binding protein
MVAPALPGGPCCRMDAPISPGALRSAASSPDNSQMQIPKLYFALAATCAFAATGAQAATEIHLWHAGSGKLEAQIQDIASRFNAAQAEYTLLPEFKRADEDAVAAAIAALHTGKAPHILLVSGAGTAGMIARAARGKTIKPAYEVMAQAGEKFDAKSYLPAVVSDYSDAHGRLLSLPFSASTAVFFYNKDAFKKAGLDPAKPPRTWDEVQAAALLVKDAGVPCSFTTGWQSRVHLENMSAWHNEEFATRSNGFAGTDAKLVFNNMLMVRHIAKLSSWVKSMLFTYAGRGSQGEAKFADGECAMLTSSSNAYADIKRAARFEFGVSQLPYYDDFKDAPHNSVVSGASLWVLAGRNPAEYKGVAKFFGFLSSPEIQAEWSQKTGYLPITRAAYDLGRKQGFYEANPGADVAMQQLLTKHPTKYSRGIRLGDYAQIRSIIDEELESVWSQKKSPKEALDAAVEQGNALLRKFEQAYRAGAH